MQKKSDKNCKTSAKSREQLPDNRVDSCQSAGTGGMEASEVATYRHEYDGLTERLTVTVAVTALTPMGEHTLLADGIWDTGATNTVISKALADRLGIVPMRTEAGERQPMTMVDTRYEGKAVIRLRIGDVVTPMFTAKVSDFDPDGRFAKMGYQLPEFVIGMDVIASGRLTVDSLGDRTMLTFEF